MFIFPKPLRNLVQAQRFYQVFAGCNRLVGNSLQSSNTHNFQGCKFLLYNLNSAGNTIQAKIFTSITQSGQVFCTFSQIQAFVQFIQCFNTLLCSAFKLTIVKLHFYNSLIDTCAHSFTTSCHASSAIFSNTGRSAGLI